tara:strand:- start:6501 stop:7172 length:672 start_codon:yes stop_codon:yes gene_type:complete
MTEFGSDIVYGPDGEILYDPSNPGSGNFGRKPIYDVQNFAGRFDAPSDNPFASRFDVVDGVPPTTGGTVNTGGTGGTGGTVNTGGTGAPPTTGGGDQSTAAINLLDSINKNYMTDYNSYLRENPNNSELSWINSPVFQNYENQIISGIGSLGYGQSDYNRIKSDYDFHSTRAIDPNSPYAGSSARIANALQNKLNVFNAGNYDIFNMADGGLVSYNRGIKSLI